MTRNVIHIGFPKTGTTTLQKWYFSTHPEFAYLGQTNIPADLRKWFELDVLCKSEMEYEREPVIRAFREKRDQLMQADPGKTFVFSHEALTYYTEAFRVDMAEMARRVKDIFGEARIVITIRSQDTMLCSLYQQAVQGGAFVSLDSYLGFYRDQYYASILPVLKYVPVIQCYERLFGKGNVHVQCFEEFVSHPEDFFSRLSEFCGVKNMAISCPHENAGLTGLGVQLQRVANRVCPYDLGAHLLRPPIRNMGEKQKRSFLLYYKHATNLLTGKIGRSIPFGRKIVLSDYWKNEIDALYRESNRILAKEYGLDLERYKYPGL
ncbi:MAG: sulfotransferase [Nitrosomonadales bacterium]|nr:sulfotransferase [Nitrosomonadales bacterium]